MPPRLTRRATLAAGLAWGSAARAGDLPGDLVGTDPGTTVPFSLQGGAIILQVAVNGAPPAPFLLDSGSSITILDSGFAARNGFHPEGGGKVRGVKGAEKPALLLQDLSLTCGGLTLPPQDAGVVDLPNFLVDRGKRPPLGGIVGLNFFAPHTLRIDFGRRQLTILPADADPDPDGVTLQLATTMRVLLAKPTTPVWVQVLVRATLDGIPMDLLLDTGANGTVHLRDEFVRENGLAGRFGKHVDIRAPGGIDGTMLTSLAIGQSLQVGPLSVASPLVAMARETGVSGEAVNFRGVGDDAGRRTPFPQHVAGSLGLGALSAHTLFIDPASQRLVLEGGGIKARPTVWRSAGLSLTKPAHDYFEILTVIPGTAAAAAGLTEGGRIVAVNGTPATDLALFDYGHAEAAGKVTVRLASGAEHMLGLTQLLP
jgi:hypothetical protein